jgi:hypothetical protein
MPIIAFCSNFMPTSTPHMKDCLKGMSTSS